MLPPGRRRGTHGRTSGPSRRSRPDQPAADSLRNRARAGRIAYARGGVASHDRGRLQRAWLAMRRDLGGQSGAKTDAVRRDLACAGTRLRRVHQGNGHVGVRARCRPAGTRLEASRACLDTRRHSRRQFSSSRGGRTRRASCRVRRADHGRTPRAGRTGVLQPRHPRALAGSAGDDDDDQQPGRPVHRGEESQRRPRPLLQAVTGSVLRRHVRRLPGAGQSGLAEVARSARGGAAIDAVHGLDAPRRPGPFGRRGGDAGHRRPADRLREPVSNEGRIVQMDAVVRRAVREAGTHLRRRA